MTLKIFKEKFEESLIEELLKMIPKLKGQVVRTLNVGIYPWYGYIEFSILLQEEFENSDDDELKYDVSAWQHYNFNEFQTNQESPIYPMDSWIQEKFGRINYFQYDKFFRIAADIVNSENVQKVIEEFEKSKDFYCSVYDPDDFKYRNYCTGYKKSWLQNIFIFRFLDLVKEFNGDSEE